eukprot:1896114-Rhodomonas_salina.1
MREQGVRPFVAAAVTVEALEQGHPGSCQGLHRKPGSCRGVSRDRCFVFAMIMVLWMVYVPMEGSLAYVGDYTGIT